jgi:hypothetical protein
VAVTSRPPIPRIAVIGIGLSFALAVTVGVVRAINAEPVERAAEVFGNAGFAVVFAAPGLLALLGLRGRPSLLVAAGVLDLALAFVTLMSLIGLAFVVPGVMFFVAASQMRGSGGRPARSLAATLVAVILGTASFLALFAREDPVCWATNSVGESVRLNADRYVTGTSISIESPPGATASGCSSDSISTIEGLAGIVLVATLLGCAWVLSEPSDHRAARLPWASRRAG